MKNKIIYALENCLSDETEDYLKRLDEIDKEVQNKLEDLR